MTEKDVMQEGNDRKKKGQTEGYIHSLETFGSVDGPGIRFVVFLQGCRLRCQFCHNPDSWKLQAGERITAEELMEKALNYQSYWGEKGGITASGGEPLLQMDFLLDLFTLAKEKAIHTCIDTAGQPFTRQEPFFGKFNRLMKLTDLLLLDIKHMDEEGHRRLTGASNQNILDMAQYLSEIGKPVWIRHVLVPERNDSDAFLLQLKEFVHSLNNVRRFEVLPYHTMGIYKWKELNIPYPLSGIDSPKKERVAYVNRLLGTEEYRGYRED